MKTWLIADVSFGSGSAADRKLLPGRRDRMAACVRPAMRPEARLRREDRA